ncbi:bifunctional 4-hydroxy-2-oxoglutarate aldolase/2-dehydro-3-deoxy-phosphogluconate aldolase [Chryseobacterium hagamense]|uniref:Bifunctional 4-hydroxy-2-oxoglutarate aldolase/2-dehydro-3-deoxy-phosphogluconate aldolase n=1 Tax=Chryseobacterium hagamense TaxID=395935 RepID=A0A511YSU1_9FLAO|nr:bifunctional 4-hydroxy-2-oxoglutarate aldolase/2-dehydro-3-deoxy-phosphogluconate aldolase [Chryseobacterium hagamense]GEN78242.1 bifunctional 4-hydroxy-2-oxoglutarate aldolase/2-dehydro-3-deoxy-phosphogluconate aldolase [Chryseobacterium hagamense]
MRTIQSTTDTIISQGVLPLYYHAEESVSLDILRSLYRAGIRAVEYTSRGGAALGNFTKMVEIRTAEMPEMLLGIGTIKSLQQAEEYHRAGADFFISPGFVPEVAEYLIPKDLLYSPGCMTPTEIIAAEKAGVTFIKLFPGNVLGAGFMSAVKDVFPNLKFMPTGGVDTTKESIGSWFKAGVSAVGMGSKLISKELMQAKDYGTIEKETRKVMELIRELK